MLHHSKQFHVSPCHCFPPPLKPRLSQCAKRHMTARDCCSTSPTAHRTSVSLPAHRQEVKAERLSPFPSMLHNLSPTDTLFAYTSPVHTSPRDRQILNKEVASVHHNEATASCGALQSILSKVGQTAGKMQ